MYIMDDGIRLSAKLEMPEKQAKKMPVVVIIHGFTGHKDEPHLLAVNKALLEAGCVTLRADMYGHGESGGAFRDHNLFKWMNNAMALVDYAKALPFAGDIYLLGHSEGGLTAFLTAAMERDVTKGLMALSPANMIPEIARQGSLLGYPYDPEHLPAEIPAWNGRTLGSNYIAWPNPSMWRTPSTATRARCCWCMGITTGPCPFSAPSTPPPATPTPNCASSKGTTTATASTWIR
jgi:pimeloyl-ACP methyl ester carboxylesterase